MAQKAYRKETNTTTRTVSSNEAKQHWGAMLKAASSGEVVIVESHGKPKAVVISPEAFEEYQQAREQQRRQDVMVRLCMLKERIGKRNQDLTDEERDELAERASREAIDDLADEGRLIFERDRQ